MLQIMTMLIIFSLLVCAVIILFNKANYFRQQSKGSQKKESDFIYELIAEGKLNPGQAFRIDDFTESPIADKGALAIEKTDNEFSIKEIRSLIFNRINELSKEKMQQILKYLDGEQTQEQRRYDRKDFYKIIDYAVGDRFYRDFIQNISAGGAFIETSQTFSKGQKILMIFMSPDHQSPFKINGEIVRIHSDGIGVTFKLKSQVQEMVLKGYIRKIQNS